MVPISGGWPSIDFTPKAINMNIDNVGIGLNAHAPNLIENHGARDDATWIPAQILKQSEFLPGEMQDLTVAKSLPPKEIQL